MPTQSDLVQIVTVVCGLIGAMFSAYIAYKMAELNTRVSDVKADLKSNTETTDAIHEKLTTQAAHAAGVSEGTQAAEVKAIAEVTAKPEAAGKAVEGFR